ncbi:hypothetical protein WDJ51_03665 [Rathayibacter sp. YIM 133350]|uniref:hypothetical protein n=1 Tax=Rathayibacter sp. YIM 133350 TaxID=3131992 RepID=UPI00307F16BE
MSPEPNGAPAHRAERVIASMAAACIGLSIISIIAVLIAAASGLSQTELSQGFWQVVFWIPGIGLPIGLVLIVAWLVTSLVRRSREAKRA